MSTLTTVDNPYDPSRQWREWLAWDRRAGYNTPGLLVRVIENAGGDPDDETAIEDAIDRIVALDGLYRKVESTDEDGDEPEVDEDEWAEILAEMRADGVEDLDEGRVLAARDLAGNNFERYWTRGKGLARWRFHPHPWRRLRALLRKHKRIRDPEGLASTYFRKAFGYWPGHRKGSNPVGPG